MLTIDNAVYKSYPDAKMGILAIKNVDASAPPEQASAAEAAKEIRRRYGHLDRAGLKALHPMQSYVDYCKQFGYSYHVLAQLESILNGKRTVSANSGLVSAMFLTELDSMLLTAGHDLSALHLPLDLKVASEDDRYQSISGKDVTTVQGDLMVCSGDNVVSSILRGPDSLSKISASTTNVLFTIYAPPGIDKDAINSALRNLDGKILSFSPGSEILCKSVYANI